MKQIASGLAWTLSIAWAGTYVALFLSIPVFVPAMLSLAVGLFIGMDPMHRIWGRPGLHG